MHGIVKNVTQNIMIIWHDTTHVWLFESTHITRVTDHDDLINQCLKKNQQTNKLKKEKEKFSYDRLIQLDEEIDY